MRNSLASTLLRLFRERSQGTSLKSLAKEGVQKVTVLDAAKLQELVEQAVQDTLLKRGIEIGSGEREAFLAEAAEKVKMLMHERDSYRAQSSSLEHEKSILSEELASMTRRHDRERKDLELELATRDRTLTEERNSVQTRLDEQAQGYEVKMTGLTRSIDREKITLSSQIEVLKRDLDQTRLELLKQKEEDEERMLRERELDQKCEESPAEGESDPASPDTEQEDESVSPEEVGFLSNATLDLPGRLRDGVRELLEQRTAHAEGKMSPELLREIEAISEGIVNLNVGILNDLRRQALSQARGAQRERIENLERRIDKLKGSLANAEDLLVTVQHRQADDGIKSVYRESQGVDPGDARYEDKKQLLEAVFNQNLVLRGLIQEGGVE